VTCVRICQRVEKVSTVTLKLLRALGHWCNGVEDVLGRARWSELPPTSRRRFETLSEQVLAHAS
jgi:hypothetical protein